MYTTMLSDTPAATAETGRWRAVTQTKSDLWRNGNRRVLSRSTRAEGVKETPDKLDPDCHATPTPACLLILNTSVTFKRGGKDVIKLT